MFVATYDRLIASGSRPFFMPTMRTDVLETKDDERNYRHGFYGTDFYRRVYGAISLPHTLEKFLARMEKSQKSRARSPQAR